MSLQDQHLQQALKHAPDRDMVPNDATRAAVLTYANKAVQRRQDTWWKRISEWFGFNLHSVGLGSAIATVLIVVVFWHEQPDDTMWRAAAPSEERNIGDSVNESSVQSAPEAASVEKTLDAASSGAAVPAQKSPAKVAKLKSSSLAEEIPQSAPVVTEPEMHVAAAPAPAPMAQDKAVVASAPAAIDSTNDVATSTTKGELAKELQAESDAGFKMRREDIVAKKSAAKADVLGASAPKVVNKPQENQALLARIKNEGGKALANQDIQAGNLRLLKVEIQTKDSGALNCSQLTGQVLVLDALTGYKIELVGSCDATASLLKEVEVYNQTMRDWHSNHAR